MTAAIERWSFTEPFKITGITFEELHCVTAAIRDGELEGRGEAAGVYFLNDTPATILAQLESVRSEIEAGIKRDALQELLPPGGARNALDCALWDLESKRSGTPVWQLAGLPQPKSLVTTFTIPAGPPDVVARKAQDFAAARALKLKLAGGHDAASVSAVRAARPDAWLGIDANQGLTPQSFNDLLPVVFPRRAEGEQAAHEHAALALRRLLVDLQEHAAGDLLDLVEPRKRRRGAEQGQQLGHPFLGGSLDPRVRKEVRKEDGRPEGEEAGGVR